MRATSRLAAVFELYVKLRRTKQAKKSVITKWFGLGNQKRTHCIRVIIDATSSSDNKTKSRWTRALRYAWRERSALFNCPQSSLNRVPSSARPSPGKGRCNCHGKALKFYVEFNRLDHEDIAQGFKFDSRVRVGPRAPKALVRLFKQIVWS
jgi:hypothetical protein